MNERIKQLVKQAGAIGYDDDGNELTPVLVGKDLTKFAELIVRECAQLARDTDLEDVEGGDSEVLRAAKCQILKHFGVEE